jgi:hypothetical protein
MNDILKCNNYSILHKVTLVYLDRAMLLTPYLLIIRPPFLAKGAIILILTIFKG